MSAPWRGYFAAAPTPFDRSGGLDTVRLRDVLAWFLAQKAHGIVVNGTTGEWVAQTVEERRSVLEVAREEVPAGVPLLVGIGAMRADESLVLGRHAADAGADGVMLTIPPARWLRDDDILSFYTQMARQIPLPLLVYNVPAVTGYDLPVELMTRLLEIDGVVGIKDNSPSPQRRAQTLQGLGADNEIFSDVLDPGTFPVFAEEHKGRGQIGSGMPLGKMLADAFEHVWNDRADLAQPIVDNFAAFKTAVQGILGPGQPWHAQSKALMVAVGVDAGYPRFPTASIRDDEPAMARLVAVVKEHGKFA